MVAITPEVLVVKCSLLEQMRKKEAEEGAVKCPASPSKLVAKSGLALRSADISPLKEGLYQSGTP